ncbi:YcjF family protein [Spirabiliibacterium falconis]|uniref:YcjF family protein n=1 Tax=Spirabiliibacterium falconis TaxID=572023 RepID=UPI001AACF9B0|nr:TIGR01620 family protein [Spirabiliibacterium falconis]MBE2893772.1 TIGR01620 family protein [Spirabiliibacterium falconis]
MDKKYFTLPADNEHKTDDFKAKKEFEAAKVTPDLSDETPIETQFERIATPKPRWWKRLVSAIIVLFLGATVAQSVQWIIDSYSHNQWITLVFAIVTFGVVCLGLTALWREYWRLRTLRRRAQIQQESEQLLHAPTALGADNEQARRLCHAIIHNMQLSPDDARVLRWQEQVSDEHSATEVRFLFSQNILRDLDKQARKLVSKSAAESAVIVAVSPLAIVDVLFVAWRNLALINRIAKLYGIELGYFSRIRLLRMVLVNMAFAGATELVHEIGMDWLSKDLMAKLSARAAQGLGVGLLTARLGIKTMEFCRPLAFMPDEKPRLSIIHQELLGVIKDTMFKHNKSAVSEHEYR